MPPSSSEHGNFDATQVLEFLLDRSFGLPLHLRTEFYQHRECIVLPCFGAQSEVDADLPPLETAEAPAAPAGEVCLRFVEGDWRAVSSSTSISACVQALYAGTCVRPGDALYGRFGNTTLRLVPGRVERSDDNTNFRTLVEQDRRCNLGPID